MTCADLAETFKGFEEESQTAVCGLSCRHCGSAPWPLPHLTDRLHQVERQDLEPQRFCLWV